MNIGILNGWYVRKLNGEDGPYEVTVDTFEIGCSSSRGQNWVFDGFCTENEDEAKALVAVLDLDGDTPETTDHWVEIDPTYGSEAWGPENEYELACFEADAYGEPRPRWF